jgi:hypothetical protein
MALYLIVHCRVPTVPYIAPYIVPSVPYWAHLQYLTDKVPSVLTSQVKGPGPGYLQYLTGPAPYSVPPTHQPTIHHPHPTTTTSPHPFPKTPWSFL